MWCEPDSLCSEPSAPALCPASSPYSSSMSSVATAAAAAAQEAAPHHAYLDVGEDIGLPDDYLPQEFSGGLWWRHLVAGAAAGCVSRTLTAPLDRLKVFLQVHGRAHFCGIRQCWRHMMAEGGAVSLWRGNGVNVLKIAPETAVKFGVYEYVKRQFAAARRTPSTHADASGELTVAERFAAGSVAGGVSQSLIYPLEVLKTRLALRRTGQYVGLTHAAASIYRREGARSFYRGFVPNLLGILPYAGIELAVYETLKQRYMRSTAGAGSPDAAADACGEPGVFVLLACAAASSTCGQVASYPLALIRTRLQAASADVLSCRIAGSGGNATATAAAAAIDASLLTMRGQFAAIVRREGLPGLYRGLAPNFLKVAPAVSISYVVYEKCRRALGVTMT